MMNLAKGIKGIFTSLMLSHFLLCMPAVADEASPMTSNKVCGPNCICGCREGKPCTCPVGHQKVSHEPEIYQQDHLVQSQPQTYQTNNQYGYQPTYPSYDYLYDSYVADSYGTEGCCDCPTKLRRPLGYDINGYLLYYEQGCGGGIWLPEDPPLFRPFMADPRQVTFSAGWRFNDNAMTKDNIDVSYGDCFPIYRWLDVGPWGGQLEVNIEGALWAVFNPCYDSAPLMNADYYGGMYFAYAIPNWQFRLRGYHISSHIGDEFLLNHPHFVRKNPSAEYLDFFISHDLTEEIRIYGGLGWVVAQDSSFHFDPFYSAIGAELRLLSLGIIDCREAIYGCPIFGMHFRQSGDFKKHIDATYVLGYEFGKMTGLFRRWRIYMEYHDGYSLEGQFCKTPTDYFSVRTSYGF